MQRQTFKHGDIRLSYLDSGGDGDLIVALHAMWMEAGTYRPIAEALAPKWRVVSLDQRGHGDSDHAADYAIDAFIGDIDALLDHLGVRTPVVLMGNSMGATNAFRYAARHPGRVRALVNEEGPAVEASDLAFVKPWAGVFPTRAALEAAVGARLLWSVAPSILETPRGWTLKFDPLELLDMVKTYNGDWWADWLATPCPALVVRGAESRAVDGAIMEAMAAQRPNTHLAVLRGGHVSHADAQSAFLAALRRFLDGL